MRSDVKIIKRNHDNRPKEDADSRPQGNTRETMTTVKKWIAEFEGTKA